MAQGVKLPFLPLCPYPLDRVSYENIALRNRNEFISCARTSFYEV